MENNFVSTIPYIRGDPTTCFCFVFENQYINLESYNIKHVLTKNLSYQKEIEEVLIKKKENYSTGFCCPMEHVS